MINRRGQCQYSFKHESKARILNDGFVNVIKGTPEELEKIAKGFEEEVPHLCSWLIRSRDPQSGRFMQGYTKKEELKIVK